jgi:MarR family 2-MHQ and catechol resistance regulon transcriptional repressor
MKSARSNSPTAPLSTAERDPRGAYDLTTATALKLWVVLSRAQWAVQQVSINDIESHGLTPAEFAIIEVLYHKGPLLLGEVQRKVLVSSGGITFLVDKLARRGLVERRECTRDRRARYAALTEQGEQLMRDIFPTHAAAIREAVAGLSIDQQKALIVTLKTLGKEAEEVAAGTPRCQKAIAEMKPAAE